MPDGWVIVTETTQNAAKILSYEFQPTLDKLNLEVRKPPGVIAKHTIVIKKVDDLLFDFDEQAIIQEVNKQNPETENQIIEIYKMAQHNIVKINLKNYQLAQDLKQKGMFIYGCKYPSGQIESEKFTQIPICTNCYSYNHVKAACRKTAIVCSECSLTGHTWKDCTAIYKRCIHCGGQHRTFSNQCIVRKEEEKQIALCQHSKEEYRKNR